jgi:hypothetical protein
MSGNIIKINISGIHHRGPPWALLVMLLDVRDMLLMLLDVRDMLGMLLDV